MLTKKGDIVMSLPDAVPIWFRCVRVNLVAGECKKNEQSVQSCGRDCSQILTGRLCRFCLIGDLGGPRYPPNFGEVPLLQAYCRARGS